MTHKTTYRSKVSVLTDSSSIAFIQPKLTINNPNDQYEKEADAIADKMMGMPSIQTKQDNNLFFRPSPISITPVQRKCVHCEEEEKKMQRKEMNGEAATADNGLENYISNLGNTGQPLSDEVRNFYEPRFGFDFSNVKVHTGAMAAKSAQSINALAFTSGNNIVFNKGQYSPNANSGKRLLAHELVHTLQKGGNSIKKASACPSASCPGIKPSASNCSKYWANSWWLPLAYVNNATWACLETPDEPTANCVRKTLQDRLDSTPGWLKALAASHKGFESTSPLTYQAFVQSFITPRVYSDHVFAYRTAGCPSGPAPYPAWVGVTTIPMPPGTVGLSIRYGGGSCSGVWGSWC